MVCKLSTRCTVVAATNPKGQYDPTVPLTTNCAIASPLLSRFDLVYILLDTKNAQWDRLISTYILNGKSTPTGSTSLWSLEKLQAYYCVIKSFNPALSSRAATILREYYHCQRQTDARNASRTTVRLLESLIRLSQAHSRLMYRNEVTVQDAVVAVSLIETSCSGGSDDYNLFNAVQTSFPKDPMDEYRNQATQILTKLGLTNILDEELQYLENEFQVPLDRTGVLNEGNSQERNDRGSPQEPQSEETEMGKKLGAVLNNIRQAKTRNEHMAIAQSKAAKGKKKSDSGGRKKKKGLILEALDSSDDTPDEDIIESPFSKGKRKIRSKNKEVETNGPMDSLLSDISKLPGGGIQKTITTAEVLMEEEPVYESVFQRKTRSPTPEQMNTTPSHLDQKSLKVNSSQAPSPKINEPKSIQRTLFNSSKQLSAKTSERLARFAFKKNSEISPPEIREEQSPSSSIPRRLPITNYHSQSSQDAVKLVSQSIFSMKDPNQELEELEFDI